MLFSLIKAVFPCLWTGLVTFGLLYWTLFRWIGLKDKKLECWIYCSLFWYGVSVCNIYERASSEMSSKRDSISQQYEKAVSEDEKI